MSIRLVDNPSLLVKPQYVVAHAGRTSTLHLVLVPEQALPSNTTSIVKVSVSEDSKEGTLSSIHITNHSHSAREVIGQST